MKNYAGYGGYLLMNNRLNYPNRGAGQLGQQGNFGYNQGSFGQQGNYGYNPSLGFGNSQGFGYGNQYGGSGFGGK